MAEQTTICSKCGFPSQGPRVRPHNCAARLAHPENYVPAGAKPLAVIPKATRPLTIESLSDMPASPHAARGVKDLTLPELEQVDRGLRNMPEQLENMSGISAVLNGLVLTEIKARLPHKQFTPWLEKNYGKTKRTAQFKMQLAAAFSKSETRFVFDQQLTLALLDDTQSNALDLAHPVVKQVAEWTDGRSYRRLLEEEVVDGRASNSGGFRPNAMILRAWLKQEYPKQPELLDIDVFTELPADIQKRFKDEGERYEQRLTKEERTEIERESRALDWIERAPSFLAAGLDEALEDFAPIETLRKLSDLLRDYSAQVNRKIASRSASAKGGKKALPAS